MNNVGSPARVMTPPHIFLHITNVLINIDVYSVLHLKRPNKIKAMFLVNIILCVGAIWNSYPIRYSIGGHYCLDPYFQDGCHNRKTTKLGYFVGLTDSLFYFSDFCLK